MTTDEIPDEIVKRCAKKLSDWWLLGGTNFEEPARAVLHEAGIAKLIVALSVERDDLVLRRYGMGLGPANRAILDQRIAAIDAALSRYHTGGK